MGVGPRRHDGHVHNCVGGRQLVDSPHRTAGRRVGQNRARGGSWRAGGPSMARGTLVPQAASSGQFNGACSDDEVFVESPSATTAVGL